jgi:hypothetical protein
LLLSIVPQALQRIKRSSLSEGNGYFLIVFAPHISSISFGANLLTLKEEIRINPSCEAVTGVSVYTGLESL